MVDGPKYLNRVSVASEGQLFETVVLLGHLCEVQIRMLGRWIHTRSRSFVKWRCCDFIITGSQIMHSCPLNEGQNTMQVSASQMPCSCLRDTSTSASIVKLQNCQAYCPQNPSPLDPAGGNVIGISSPPPSTSFIAG